MSVKTRQRIEKSIAEATIKAAIARGYVISVFDGEEFTLNKSADAAGILEAMFTTDEDYLYLFDGSGRETGWIRLIYGNDGWDVISDHTVNLENIYLRQCIASLPEQDVFAILEQSLTTEQKEELGESWFNLDRKI